MGTVLAAEPLEGFDANENKDALGPSGLWYATWTAGEGEAYINDEGEDATLYDAQIYLLVEECRSSNKAGEDLAEWKARERASYDCGEETEETFAGQDFSVLSLESSKSGNPYSFGAAAFAIRGNYAICVELVCRDGWTGDASETLSEFLGGLHYNDGEE